MTAVDPNTLRELSQLARLALTPDELERLTPELERILEAFAVLARQPPGARPQGEAPRAVPAREDEPVPSLAREALLASAPVTEDGFYAVPKTVGGER